MARSYIKRTFILIFIFVFLAGVLYQVNKDTLFDKARILLEKKISHIFDRPVEIGSLRFIPFYSFSIDDLTIYDSEARIDKFAFLGSLAARLDLIDSIRRRRPVAVMSFRDARYKKAISSDAVEVRTVFSLRNIFSPLPFESITITGADALVGDVGKIGDDRSENIRGVIRFDKGMVSGVDISLLYNDVWYLFLLKKISDLPSGYKMNIGSEGIELEGAATIADENRINVEEVTGTIYGMKVDLRGEVDDYTLLSKARVYMTGDVAADIEDLSGLAQRSKAIASLPGRLSYFAVPAENIGKLIGKTGIAGKIKADVRLSGLGPKLRQYAAVAQIMTEDVRLSGWVCDTIRGEVSARYGAPAVLRVTATLYGGDLRAELKLDPYIRELPYTLGFRLNGTDLDSISRNVYGVEGVRGTVDMGFTVKGNAGLSESAEGKGGIRIANADLGSIPALKPLFDDISFNIDGIFRHKDEARIKGGTADFNISKSNISTQNLKLLGDVINIDSAGHLGLDGTLDFEVLARFRQPGDIDVIWQEKVNEAIARSGEIISKGYLRGTVREPEWEFQNKEESPKT